MRSQNDGRSVQRNARQAEGEGVGWRAAEPCIRVVIEIGVSDRDLRVRAQAVEPTCVATGMRSLSINAYSRKTRQKRENHE